jgi:hypothetical protein
MHRYGQAWAHEEGLPQDCEPQAQQKRFSYYSAFPITKESNPFELAQVREPGQHSSVLIELAQDREPEQRQRCVRRHLVRQGKGPEPEQQACEENTCASEENTCVRKTGGTTGVRGKHLCERGKHLCEENRGNNRRARKTPVYKQKEGKLPRLVWPLIEASEDNTSDPKDRVRGAPASATGSETTEDDTPKDAEGTAFFEIGDDEETKASDIESVYDTLGKSEGYPEHDGPDDDQDSSCREGEAEFFSALPTFSTEKTKTSC